jgi:hypothetical protein
MTLKKLYLAIKIKMIQNTQHQNQIKSSLFEIAQISMVIINGTNPRFVRQAVFSCIDGGNRIALGLCNF